MPSSKATRRRARTWTSTASARRSTSTGSGRRRPASPGTLQVAHAFLGLRLECAQCHRHPHDVWQQDDLLSFANFFMPVRELGFQGDNEKKFPDVAAHVKKLDRRGQEARPTRSRSCARRAARNSKPRRRRSQVEATAAKTSVEEVSGRSRRAWIAAASCCPRSAGACCTPRSGTAARQGADFATRHQPARHAGVEASSACSARRSRRRAEGAGPARAGRRLDAAAGQPVLRQGDRQPRLGALLRPRHHRSARPPVAVQPADAPGAAGGTVRRLRQARLRSASGCTAPSSTAAPTSRAASPPPPTRRDRANYAYFAYRRLPAEVLLDALNQATGDDREHGHEVLPLAGRSGRRSRFPTRRRTPS